MKTWLRKNRGFLVFLVCFGFFRTAIADWNPIPSSSMRPTLLEGDVVLVDRVAYDFKLPLTDVPLLHIGEPQRGDIATFSSPTDGTRLIKRLVGLPGDTVQMRSGRLFINGIEADYRDLATGNEPLGSGTDTTQSLTATEQLPGAEHRVQYLPNVSARRDFGPVAVPADHFFVLGDNRDNSADSRYIGTVPRHLLSGRAHHVLVSAAFKEDWRLRFERWGQRLD
jgi:signal peptidase I